MDIPCASRYISDPGVLGNGNIRVQEVAAGQRCPVVLEV
jgi:hypothetical protein